MKKNILVILFVMISLITITGCTKEKYREDALKFKSDYESLNGEKNSSGKEYRTITISEDNPIYYSTFKEVKEKIENKESFIVYVGFSACPWCRSVIPYVLESAASNNIDKIYYINVREDNTRESDLRGYFKLDDKNKVVVDVYPDKYYHDVLNTLDAYLSDFTLETKDGKKISTGENRLYAPTLIAYKNGEAAFLDECISDDQTDGYQELTDNIIKDIKTKADNVFKKYNE